MHVNYQKIYEKLGYLFYAIASADGGVADGELNRLREMIKKIWIPLEDSTDEFGTDAAHYIAISFEFLMDEGMDPNDAFSEFKDYYEEHSAAFSREIKENIANTTRAIAHAFKGRNRHEAGILRKVERLLA